MKTLAIITFLILSILSGTCQDKDSVTTLWAKGSMNDFYVRYSPVDYLRVLMEDFKDKQKINVFTLTTSPDNWIREEHIGWLMKSIYKTDSTKSIMTPYSSSIPTGKYSSVGREAQNLINCFRKKVGYPDFLTSFGAPDKAKARELEQWWKNYKLLGVDGRTGN